MKTNRKMRKISKEYLAKMCSKSIFNIFNKNIWKSKEVDTYGKSRILLHTRKSVKQFGNELNIFKYPTIEGLKIIYHKSMSMFFDKYDHEHQMEMISEENYLLRDLSTSSECGNENELKIFKLPTIEKLEKLYYKSIGKI